MRKLNFCLLISVFILFIACRTDEVIIPKEVVENLAPPENTAIKGFYVLNEGNMGSNKCTLDFFDYTKGTDRKSVV